MSSFDKKMEKLFDVTPAEEVQVEKTLPVVITQDENANKQDLSTAYSQSKDNLNQLIDAGHSAMDELLQICKEGQHPRAFEVYATLLKNMGELNDKLLDTQKKIRDIEGTKNKEKASTTIDKAIFVGSTSELQKMLKNNGN